MAHSYFFAFVFEWKRKSIQEFYGGLYQKAQRSVTWKITMDRLWKINRKYYIFLNNSVNRDNTRIYELNVWTSIIDDQIIRPFSYGKFKWRYLKLLTNAVNPTMRKLLKNDWQYHIDQSITLFQHNVAPPHYSLLYGYTTFIWIYNNVSKLICMVFEW